MRDGSCFFDFSRASSLEELEIVRLCIVLCPAQRQHSPDVLPFGGATPFWRWPCPPGHREKPKTSSSRVSSGGTTESKLVAPGAMPTSHQNILGPNDAEPSPSNFVSCGRIHRIRRLPNRLMRKTHFLPAPREASSFYGLGAVAFNRHPFPLHLRRGVQFRPLG